MQGTDREARDREGPPLVQEPDEMQEFRKMVREAIDEGVQGVKHEVQRELARLSNKVRLLIAYVETKQKWGDNSVRIDDVLAVLKSAPKADLQAEPPEAQVQPLTFVGKQVPWNGVAKEIELPWGTIAIDKADICIRGLGAIVSLVIDPELSLRDNVQIALDEFEEDFRLELAYRICVLSGGELLIATVERQPIAMLAENTFVQWHGDGTPPRWVVEHNLAIVGWWRAERPLYERHVL